MKKYDTFGDKVLLAVIYIILAVLFVIMLYPFWETVVLSISGRKEAMESGVHLWTSKPTLYSFKQVLKIKEFWGSMYNSLVRVVLGTLFSVVFTSLTAYPLSKKDLPGKKFITNLFIFTMLFSGGLIPGYLVIKELNMLNTIWALVLPGCVGAYNLIIMRNFLYSIPDALPESAYLDGASELKIWFYIILPLSKPVMATIALWMAINHWNAYLDALIYITDQTKYVLSIILRRVLITNESNMLVSSTATTATNNTEVANQTELTIKSTLIVFSIIPIALFYPFLQKYFSKGIMLGAVKG